MSESGRFTEPNVLKFFAAREAFWDYDTDTAVRLLRELREAKAMSDDHFHETAVLCYEQSGRWEDVIAWLREFGLEERHAGRLKWAQFRAGLPAREIAFAIRFTDTDERFLVMLENAVLRHRRDEGKGGAPARAHASVAISRDTLVGLMLDERTLDEALAAGDVRIDGDTKAFADLLGLLDRFDFWFEIVMP